MAVRDHSVLEANLSFYRALRTGDLAAMDTLWSRRAGVSCTHPGRAMIVGRAGVMESWRVIMTVVVPPIIRCEAPRAVITGGSAMVLCRERVMGGDLMAVNAFLAELGEGAAEPVWRLIGHHASELP